MRTQQRPWTCSAIGRMVFVLLIASAPTACVINPATGRSQLNMLSREQEIAIGERSMGQVLRQYGGPVDDEYMQTYVARIGMSLVPFTEADYSQLPWEFTVLNSDVVNAFALPGGKVFITQGLLVKLDDEAELAGVLGHEIGHVTAEHADKRLSSQFLLTGALVGASIASSRSDSDLVRIGTPLLVGVGGQGFLLSFSRKDELEADSLGMRYMTRAGYDPAAMRDVMKILENESKKRGGSRGLEFFNTHPYPEKRIQRINERLAVDYPPDLRAKLTRSPQRFRDSVPAPTFDQ